MCPVFLFLFLVEESCYIYFFYFILFIKLFKCLFFLLCRSPRAITPHLSTFSSHLKNLSVNSELNAVNAQVRRLNAPTRKRQQKTFVPHERQTARRENAGVAAWAGPSGKVPTASWV